MIIVAVTVLTAIILTILFWGYRRKREEQRLRKQGVVTIPIDAGYLVKAGCLGVLGYLGLLFVLVSLTLDLLEQAAGPDWLVWVVAIGLLVGFFAMVGWAAFGIGSSFATTRLVIDKQGIRLISRGRTKTVILWDKQWRLEQMAHLRRAGYRVFDDSTEYKLLMRLHQRKNELLLVFDATGEEVGRLTPYEGTNEGNHILDEAEWLRSEILFRYERWDESPRKKPAVTRVNSEYLVAIGPDAALINALDFTEEDLADNRNGLCKASQISPIRRDQTLTLATYVVLAAAFGAGTIFSLNRLFQGQSFETIGPWLIVCLLATSFCVIMAIITRWEINRRFVLSE